MGTCVPISVHQKQITNTFMLAKKILNVVLVVSLLSVLVVSADGKENRKLGPRKTNDVGAWDGDSITDGWPSCSNPISWATQCFSNNCSWFRGGWSMVTNFAQSGSIIGGTTNWIQAEHIGDTNPTPRWLGLTNRWNYLLDVANRFPTNRKFALECIGANNNGTPTPEFMRIWTNNYMWLHTNGYYLVAVAVPPSCTGSVNPTNQPNRLEHNAAIEASGMWDCFINLDNVITNPCSKSVLLDGLHPGTLGAKMIADAVNAVLESVTTSEPVKFGKKWYSGLEFHAILDGGVGQKAIVESSIDMQSWTAVSTNVITVEPPVFVDNSPTVLKFFRIRTE